MWKWFVIGECGRGFVGTGFNSWWERFFQSLCCVGGMLEGNWNVFLLLVEVFHLQIITDILYSSSH